MDPLSTSAVWLQNNAGSGYLGAVLLVSVLSFAMAVLFARFVIRQDTGTQAMEKISDPI